jgi:amidophosphoribosyltransferase
VTAIRENCGLCAVIGDPEALALVAEGLHAQQHRGQEAAGILVRSARGLEVHKGLGLVSQVVAGVPEDWRKPGITAAMGHVRYGTFGSGSLVNAQPLLVELAGTQIAIAHNGTLCNASALRRDLERRGSIFQTNSDTEVVLHLMASELENTGFDVRHALEIALGRLEGAFCFLVMTPDGLYAIRDPLGFRPLSLGRIGASGWAVASETIAFPLCCAEYIREIEAGEILWVPFDGGGPSSMRMSRSHNLFGEGRKLAQCIFEHVYFARPGSFVFGDSVYDVRLRMGMRLAIESPAPCDVVIPVPDSGMFAALGYSRQIGVMFDMGFTRNHYVGRTFIDPATARRAAMVTRKLQPIPEAVSGKRVCVVEDSIVRGTTSRARIKALREAGASEVHMRVSCPPHRFGCFFGIDFPEPSSLIANNMSMEEITRTLGVDSLAYLSREGMVSCVSAHQPEDYCTACFNGDYPVLPPEGSIPRPCGV